MVEEALVADHQVQFCSDPGWPRDSIVAAKGLYKSYGAIHVLKGVSLDIHRGETHAVIGPNGAGKTTLFKVLSGEILADAGEVLLNGSSVAQLDGYKRARLGVGRTFQVARVFSELTALENVSLAIESRTAGAGLRGLVNVDIRLPACVATEAARILADVGMASKRHEQAGLLAYGDRKQLELAMCLSLRPRVMFLDEPMAGMSPGDRAAAVVLIRRLSQEFGISVLLTEHDMDVVFALADRITVMNYGEVIASGTPDMIRSSATVREVYLGEEDRNARN
ncbi:Lipopolysaccharide export system ATP-binding protein LptB [Cupriavidus numazuensis]|uniref:Lipopolysaccharide export system ATP-binding protein LptB n=2 Tax=Cupriavidus numazuensis TaxID=221992 RepID=A0ABM8TV35_9BURK|nr:ABC transporter ATP-binding protein [Cupriavidus numazuensis]CAG2160368.1 Lipopolysaccharide export system ATP-binding protein LptB [Cupriavidus numazuensis]